MLNIQSFKLNRRATTTLTVTLLAALVIGLTVAVWGNSENGQRILVAMMTLMCSLGLMQLTVSLFSVRHFTIVSFPYLFFAVGIFLPAFGFLPVDQSGLPQVYKFPAGHWIAFEEEFLLAVQIGMVMIPIGVLCANILFWFNRSEIKSYFARPLLAERPGYILLLYRLLLLFSLAIVLYHISKIRIIPIFYVLANPGRLAELALLREESLKLLNVPFYMHYLFAWTSGFFLPIATMLALKMFVGHKHPRWLLRFFLALGLMLFYTLMTAQKAPAVHAIISLVLFMYLARLVKINWRTILMGGLITGLALFAVLSLTRGYVPVGENFFVALRFFYYRFVEVPSTVLYWHFTIFPVRGEFLGGRTIRLWAVLTGQSHFNTPLYVNSILYPTSFKSGYANAAYLANAYTDFGFTGMVVMSFLVGFVFHSVQIYIVRREKSLLNLALFACIIATAMKVVSTDLPSTLLGSGVAFAVFLMAVTSLVLKKKRLMGSQGHDRRYDKSPCASP